MHKIGKQLAALRKAKKISQQAAADYLVEHGNGVGHNSISRWEKDTAEPSATQFLFLCKLYGVDDVLGTFGMASTPKLNSEGQSLMKTIATALARSGMYTPILPKGEARTLRLYEIPASAGTGQLLDSEEYTMVEVDSTVPGTADFGVRVQGDSMEPRFTDGQAVWVHEQPTLDDGEIGIFSLNGTAYIKKLGHENGRVQLISLNTQYSPIVIKEGDDVRVFGKVVG